MLKYFICSTFLGSWVRVKWVTNVEGGRGDKRLKMGMQRRGGDGIVVQLSSLHWPQINTYAMHKILVTTGYWNDNADNCLNVLQPSAREMIKMTSRGRAGWGKWVQKMMKIYVCYVCAHTEWPMDPMIRCNAKLCGSFHKRESWSTSGREHDDDKTEWPKRSKTESEPQLEPEPAIPEKKWEKGKGGKHAAAKTVSNEIPMKTREPLDYEFVCMQTGVNFY